MRCRRERYVAAAATQSATRVIADVDVLPLMPAMMPPRLRRLLLLLCHDVKTVLFRHTRDDVLLHMRVTHTR